MQLAIDRVGRYITRRAIARGSSGSVYEAWDPNFERALAIKLMPLPEQQTAETAENLERFRQGARAAAKLSHPNIVAVYDYGENGDYAYLVMEYIDGPTLKSVFDDARQFDLPDIRSIVGPILDALQYSHDHGVVHRDIKPDNILFTSDGKVKVTDFGIARMENSEMTQAGMVLGSPAYMSPEQFVGERTDARTDIYSTGVVLYEMLTGERAYTGSITTIMHNKLYGPLPTPTRSPGLLTPPLERLVNRAIARDRDARFGTAAEFRGALVAAISQSQAQPAPVPDKPGAKLHAARDNRIAPARTARVGRPVVLGASALAVLLAGGAMIWHFSGPALAPASPPKAAQESPPEQAQLALNSPAQAPPQQVQPTQVPPDQPLPDQAPITPTTIEQGSPAQPAPLASAQPEPTAPAPPPQSWEQAPQTPAPSAEPRQNEDTSQTYATGSDIAHQPSADSTRPLAAETHAVARPRPVIPPQASSRPVSAVKPPKPPARVASLAEPDTAAAALRRLRQEQPNPEPQLSPPPQDLDAGYPVVSSSVVGLLCSSITPETASSFGLDGARGMVVTGVVVGSPADKAGLRQNDVILKIDGQETRTLTLLTKIASAAAPGQTVAIDILHHGTPRTVQLNVGALHH